MAFQKRKLVPPAIIIVAVGLLALLSIMRPQPPQRQTERPPVLVDVIEVQAEDVNFLVAGQGNVEAKHATMMMSQVSGKVIELSPNFVAGGFFKAGEVLVKIDPADYEVALKTAKANLAQAKAQLAQESALAKVARDEWESLQMGEIPALGIREPQVASAVAGVQSAEAAVAKAERDLERTVIRAPYDGLLQSKNVDIGQFVGINSQVARIMSTETAEIRVPLSDRDLAFMNLPEPGDDPSMAPQVQLTSEVSGQPVTWYGRLVRTEGVLDMNSRVVYGVVEVADPYNRSGDLHEQPLRFGRFVQLSIAGKAAQNLYRIPRYAVNQDNKVWTVDGDRRLQLQAVDVVRAEANQVYVSSGLNSGDKVVLTQLANALPSMKVRLPGDPLPLPQERASAKQDDDTAVKPD
ncbi:efflux RND transporter periplasmic adaptor subunit [Pseudidiomarina mangrovi]|uniref:efflux RND transporter periplasmic adaptor subunit n=1 Tax=Pseudidiomarina mangrovi TaxID=2487133 RepID=UPI000FCA0F54|nr:efflux RND transporter periplasmic adaptor subunit [Pseudidiomarina mangrovi]